MKPLLFVLVAACAALPLAAADAPARPATPPKAAPTPAPAGVQKMATDFSQQREAQLLDRKTLLEKLRTAKTEEEKQRLLADLRREQQQRIELQREAAREKRDQLRDSRK